MHISHVGAKNKRLTVIITNILFKTKFKKISGLNVKYNLIDITIECMVFVTFKIASIPNEIRNIILFLFCAL